MSGGRASKAKGSRRERQIVNLQRALGIEAERVPLSGAVGGRYSGYVDLRPFDPERETLLTEVKARANGEGFIHLDKWLGEHDAMFLVRDRADPLVLLPWRTWEQMLRRLKQFSRL